MKMAYTRFARGEFVCLPNDDAYYVLGLNGQGQVSIWLRSDGRWTELRHLPVNWTPAEGAKPKGQTNHLVLIDNGDELIAYVNGHNVIEIQSGALFRSGVFVASVSCTSSCERRSAGHPTS